MGGARLPVLGPCDICGKPAYVERDLFILCVLHGSEFAQRQGPADMQADVGTIGVFTCTRCGEHTITLDVAAGVRPFTILCHASQSCPGIAHWNAAHQVDVAHPRFEWYRPTGRTMRRLLERFPHARAHLRKGGLWLRMRKVVQA